MYRIELNVIFLLLFDWCSLSEGISLNRTVRQIVCNADQFRCTEGNCIPKSDICNGLGQCDDSSDEAPSVCECGKGEATGNLLRKPPGTYDAPSGAQPWHVGIYRLRHNKHHSLICSGTLIYNDIVLTTANCVIDPDSLSLYSPDVIRVSAGKLKRDYNAEEFFQQKVEVRKIVKMDRYKGGLKFHAWNLAIIKLKQNLRTSNFVGPACLWTNKVFPSGTRRGTISGWGLQSVGDYGVNLRESLINMMDVGDCMKKFYDHLYYSFITSDKFCITFDEGFGLKDGDIGGPVTVLSDGRLYLVGIISIQPSNSEFGIATKISKHLNWIKSTVYELKEHDNCLQGPHFNCNSNSKCIKIDLVCNARKDCDDGSDEDPILCSNKPQPYETGERCEIPEGSEIFTAVKCGDSSGCKSTIWAPSNTKYQITCPDGRGFADLDAVFMPAVCQDGEWVPNLMESKCLQLCPAQEYKSLELECHYRGNQVKCNEKMRPETKIIVSCKTQFKKQKSVNYVKETKCKRDGLFLHDFSAECTPVCGVPFNMNNTTLLISRGKNTKYAKYPWHVGLYWKIKNKDGIIEFRYQCGGTLIDTNKVLTAGHCIWNKTRVMDPNNVVVAFGKYYSSWNRKEDFEQKMQVSVIIPGEHYNGPVTKHAQDIAILILSKDVSMSDYVMPACLDLNGIYGGIPKSQLGHVIGWGRLNETVPDLSFELMEAEMEYLDLDTCMKKYRKDVFSQFLLPGKFCVTYKNGSGTQKGDSGGGMTFTHENLHYVYGVVSIKKSGQDEFAVFTDVLSHKHWIRDILQD